MATQKSAAATDDQAKTEPVKPRSKAATPAPAPEAPSGGRPRRRRQRAEAMTVRAPSVAQHQTGAPKPTTKVRAEPPFWLVFAGAWTVCGDRVIPHFSRMSAQPGANNVGLRVEKGTGRHLPMVEAAKAQARERGETVLEWNVLGDGTSYIQQDPRSGGWFDIWSSVYAGSDRVVVDEAAKVAWYDRLVDLGILPLPALHQLAALHDQLEDLYVQREKDDHNKRELARQMEVVRREIAEAEAEADGAETSDGQVAATDPSTLLGD